MTSAKKPPRHRCPECRKPFMLGCSFCGKTQDQAALLVAGPDVYICDECLAICLEVMLEKKAWSLETIIRTKEYDLGIQAQDQIRIIQYKKEEKPTS